MHAVLANVIFPMFLTPYAMALLLPVYGAAALLGEIVAFCFLQFRAAPLWLLVIAVLTANIVSTAIGYPLALVLPSPAEWGKVLAVVACLVMWGLSIGIEYCVYLAVPRWRRLPRLLCGALLSQTQ